MVLVHHMKMVIHQKRIRLYEITIIAEVHIVIMVQHEAHLSRKYVNFIQKNHWINKKCPFVG